ncbi:BTB domain protein, putative [Rhizoctonia solani AG-3 Rhs1AP]|uniref:BTB domain protein, putative n=2 Tax=Rhizoctonia solani AG-3 TaxID=1086053 RepID=X8ITK4_9AGAM|nr:BTB domain protein, putative [Rhizoctonia solani AG-3 Rhs1AP]KEP44985.1 putative BTB domain protein [Rhizoctonia solani 123E]
MKKDPDYMVTIQDTNFILTKSQIEFDAPNYFTTCFLGDFEESKTLHLKLSRDPGLFRIISDYLCGYNIFPLAEQVVPARMSPQLVLTNLQIDAEFYQLDGLVEQCEALIAQKHSETGSDKRYLLLGCEYDHFPDTDVVWPLEHHIDTAVRPESRHWRTIVTGQRLGQKPLREMEFPENHTGFQGLRRIGAVERFAREMGCVDHMLVGWYHELVDLCDRSPGAHYELIVVLAL